MTNLAGCLANCAVGCVSPQCRVIRSRLAARHRWPSATRCDILSVARSGYHTQNLAPHQPSFIALLKGRDMSTNPYESPPPLESVASPAAPETTVVPFESGHARAITARIMLSLTIALDLAIIASYCMQIRLLQATRLGQVSQEQFESNDDRQQLLAVASVILMVAGTVCFVMWFHRVYRNLPALGAAGLRYTPAWAVAYWFIPILNLGRPCQVACEIWRASDPEVEETWGTAWQRARLTPLVGLWWATWLIANFAVYLASRLPTDTIDQLTSTSWCMIAATVPSLLSVSLAIWLVTAIDRRQEEKYENRLRQGQPVAVELTPE